MKPLQYVHTVPEEAGKMGSDEAHTHLLHYTFISAIFYSYAVHFFSPPLLELSYQTKAPIRPEEKGGC